MVKVYKPMQIRMYTMVTGMMTKEVGRECLPLVTVTTITDNGKMIRGKVMENLEI